MQDWLVIVHASDRLMDRFHPTEAMKLKSAIVSRIQQYTDVGKRVMYTPYIASETQIPSYFPKSLNIEMIHIDWPSANLRLPKQAIAIKKRSAELKYSSLEIGGLYRHACVKSTSHLIHTLSVVDMQRIMPEIFVRNATIAQSIGKNITVVINDIISKNASGKS